MCSLASSVACLTVLIYQHSNADARHVEPVEKVLNGTLCRRVHLAALVLLHFDHTLGHRLHHIVVPIPNEIQIGHKPERQMWLVICWSTEIRITHFCRLSWVGSAFSYTSTSSKLLTYQELTSLTDLVCNRLSGRRAISFMIFASRTGSSLRRNMYDFFSQAFWPIKWNYKETIKKTFKKTRVNQFKYAL